MTIPTTGNLVSSLDPGQHIRATFCTCNSRTWMIRVSPPFVVTNQLAVWSQWFCPVIWQALFLGGNPWKLEFASSLILFNWGKFNDPWVRVKKPCTFFLPTIHGMLSYMEGWFVCFSVGINNIKPGIGFGYQMLSTPAFQSPTMSLIIKGVPPAFSSCI